MNLTFLRTDAHHPDFQELVGLLDADLARRDGEADHAFYAQFNGIQQLNQAVVAYLGEAAVGCGAIKPQGEAAMEVKRMYVRESHRGQGIAQQILAHLETWAKELGYPACVLETGKRQPEAIRLYEKADYQRTANYGQYLGVDNSVCFRKELIHP
ncbi:MAG: GNAT family N-acetyltransferase [Bacteroidota bacterium]